MSHHSKRSGPSKASYVDESLFGNKKTGSQAAAQAATISKDQLRDIRGKTEKGQKSDAIVISKSELDRIKGTTKMQTKEQEFQHRKLLEEQKDQQMAAAKQRK